MPNNTIILNTWPIFFLSNTVLIIYECICRYRHVSIWTKWCSYNCKRVWCTFTCIVNSLLYTHITYIMQHIHHFLYTYASYTYICPTDVNHFVTVYDYSSIIVIIIFIYICNYVHENIFIYTYIKKSIS